MEYSLKGRLEIAINQDERLSKSIDFVTGQAKNTPMV
jgi:hypothetical protein